MYDGHGGGSKKLEEQVASSLWLGGGDLPWDYYEYVLCRHVYHCLPSELHEEPWENVRKHLAVIRGERRVSAHGG